MISSHYQCTILNKWIRFILNHTIKITMQYIKDIASDQSTGFSFDNFRRNEFLKEKNLATAPKTVKTGTTIAGMIFKVGLMVANMRK